MSFFLAKRARFAGDAALDDLRTSFEPSGALFWFWRGLGFGGRFRPPEAPPTSVSYSLQPTVHALHELERCATSFVGWLVVLLRGGPVTARLATGSLDCVQLFKFACCYTIRAEKNR